MPATPLPLRSIVELPPETTGALTFHLPLEVFALQDAGAPESVISARIAEGLAQAFKSGLVDPPMYRWAVEHYRPVAKQLLARSRPARLAAFAPLAPLGDGLVGAAFHGLIRTGYGALRRDADEIARGLAYLRTRRQVLHGPRRDTRSAGAGMAGMPPLEVLDGTTVFDQLSIAAGAGDTGGLGDPSGDLPTAVALAARATDLVRHDAGSFVAVHAVTGLHGLAELHHLVTGEAPGEALATTPLASWWRAYAIGLHACELVVTATPFVGRTECAPRFKTVPALLKAAVASGDTHSVKLAVAMRRLAHFEMMDERAMLELGEIKLGVDECGL